MPINDVMFDQLGEEDLEFLSARSSNASAIPPDAERVELFNEGRYAAYTHDLGFGWRWALVRDGQDIQEGPALSLESARRSARQAMAFYARLDRPSAA